MEEGTFPTQLSFYSLYHFPLMFKVVQLLLDTLRQDSDHSVVFSSSAVFTQQKVGQGSDALILASTPPVPGHESLL